MERVLERSAPFSLLKKDELVPVKITIGDAPCVYHTSPELVRSVLSGIRQRKAKPFLFDTSVIYHGQRRNAVDHLNLAQKKGFGQEQMDAPFVIADGLLGQDGRELAIDGSVIKKVKVPSFVGMLESLYVVSHATGHIVSGFAAALKNVAMGMSCRSSKQMQHSSLKPSVIEKKCIACGCCIAVCPANAIGLKKGKAYIDKDACFGCAECLCACKFDAVSINWQEDPGVFCRRMVEVASVILEKFSNAYFINLALDITKECDCISAKGERMVSGNIGILASRDILSLDKATADLALAHSKSDYFYRNKGTFESMFEYAARKRLGSLEYELIRV